jgi:hypothetical protein
MISKICKGKQGIDGMSKHSRILTALLAMACIADAGPAHAYIDPGMGSLLLQGAVGGLATFMVVMRLYGAKAKRCILGLLGRAPAQADQNTHAPE